MYGRFWVFTEGLTGELMLMGVAHGHWDTNESDRQRGVNVGIAVVIPVDKIADILNQPEMVEARKQEDERYLHQISPSMDYNESE